MTTTPLLPPSPLYYCIEALVEDIWNESMKLEERYYANPSEDLTLQFAMNVLIIQYWESVSMQMQLEARE